MEYTHVHAPPAKPLMVFDGECSFCAFWILRWQRTIGEGVEFAPFQHPRVAAQFPELSRERFERSVQLISPEGVVYCGAEAVFRSLAINPRHRLWFRLYQKLPGFAALAEAAYHFVARHRAFFSRLTRLAGGRQ
jgi:predicted DCC family thiol-disulfide oxidoreductase YuxK